MIVITAFGNIEGALDCIQRGAWDYLTKPFNVDELVHAVRRALEQRRLIAENRRLRGKAEVAGSPIGRSAVLLEVYKQAARAAASQVPVLITGETGTGKELVARAIHARSPNARGPFVPVDCGAIAESLMESELFGHARGAFTGAVAARRGLFEEATGGTLFLDEIGHIGARVQSQLLRAVQEGEIRRVGESTSVKVETRLVTATNRDLHEMVRQGQFRRGPALPARRRASAPALRCAIEKKHIPVLVQHFVGLHSRGGMPAVVTEPAMERLMAYSWPGNVRQLEEHRRAGVGAERDRRAGAERFSGADRWGRAGRRGGADGRHADARSAEPEVCVSRAAAGAGQQERGRSAARREP